MQDAVEFTTFNNEPTLKDIHGALQLAGLQMEIEQRFWRFNGRPDQPCKVIIIRPIPIKQEDADVHAETCGI